MRAVQSIQNVSHYVVYIIYIISTSTAKQKEFCTLKTWVMGETGQKVTS